MSLAAESVAATGELLEMILLSMDTETLLCTALRVCRSWHHIIKTTSKIQESLFFDPERARKCASAELPHTKLNPLLLNPDPTCFDSPSAFVPPPKPGLFDTNFYPIIGRLGYMRLYDLALNKAELEAVDDSFIREGASWRSMYTSLPPCKTVAVISHRGQGQAPLAPCSRPSLPPLSGVFEYENGMRMGDLFDLTVAHCTAHPVDGFLIVSLGATQR